MSESNDASPKGATGISRRKDAVLPQEPAQAVSRLPRSVYAALSPEQKLERTLASRRRWQLKHQAAMRQERLKKRQQKLAEEKRKAAAIVAGKKAANLGIEVDEEECDDPAAMLQALDDIENDPEVKSDDSDW